MVVFTWKTLRIENHSSKQENNPKKQMVTLVIPEPLPGMKELTGALEEHWVTMIHAAIEKKSITGIPKFHKAMVMIEVTTPRGMNNPKGTFFP